MENWNTEGYLDRFFKRNSIADHYIYDLMRELREEIEEEMFKQAIRHGCPMVQFDHSGHTFTYYLN